MARLLNQARSNYDQAGTAINGTADATLNVVGEDVAFTKTVSPQNAKVGDTVTYTITIMNENLYDDISNVVVSDMLNPRTEIVPGTLKVDGVANAGDITAGIAFPALVAGEGKAITFDATVLPK